MGGVDLYDMLLALYRIRLGTCKEYMNIVYYLIGICIVNAWLLYRRHCDQRKEKRKDVLTLLKFHSKIANPLVLAGKAEGLNTQSKRGRPSAASSSPSVPRDDTFSSVPPAFSLSISDTHSEAISCSSFLENNLSTNYDLLYTREELELEAVALWVYKGDKNKVVTQHGHIPTRRLRIIVNI